MEERLEADHQARVVVSLAEFGGTLRALSRSSSVSRRWMISAGMDDEVRSTLGSVPNMAVYGVPLYPGMIRGILHLLNKLNTNNPIL